MAAAEQKLKEGSSSPEIAGTCSSELTRSTEVIGAGSICSGPEPDKSRGIRSLPLKKIVFRMSKVGLFIEANQEFFNKQDLPYRIVSIESTARGREGSPTFLTSEPHYLQN